MAPSVNRPQEPSRSITWFFFLFLFCLAYSLLGISSGWDHPLVDYHGFRQTQTALSTYFMVGRPPTLAYETPVLGPPWPIPYEFPLFEWIVAGIVTLCHTPLDQTGRFVSATFFFLSLIPAFALLRSLSLAPRHCLVVLSLWLVSPFYLFWSRTFMIESTALFLSLCYLALAVSISTSRPALLLTATLLFGSLAAAVKLTTFVLFYFALLLCLAGRTWPSGMFAPSPPGRKQFALWRGLIGAFPLAVGFAWTRYTDYLKEMNPLGQILTSRALWDWNFGTLAQRLDVHTWLTVHFRLIDVVNNRLQETTQPTSVVVGTILTVILVLVVLWAVDGRWKSALGCLAIYIVGSLVFTNLYVRHDYYGYANNLFATAAAGLCAVSFLEKGRWYAVAGLGALVAFMTLSGYRYYREYDPLQVTFNPNWQYMLEFSKALNKATAPEEILLGVGYDWSSELPYYSQRRSLMLPEYVESVNVQDMPRYLAHARDYRIGALIVNRGSRFARDREAIQSVLRSAGLAPRASYFDGTNEVYLRTEGGVPKQFPMAWPARP